MVRNVEEGFELWVCRPEDYDDDEQETINNSTVDDLLESGLQYWPQNFDDKDALWTSVQTNFFPF